MLHDLERLWELQEIDAQIREIEAARSHLRVEEQRAVAERQVSAAREAAATSQRDLSVKKRAVQRLEAELAAHEANLAQREERLYSGAVTSPRELQQLEGQLAALRRAQERLTEEILAAWEALEAAERQVKILTQRMEVAAAEATSRANDVAEQDSRLAERLASAHTRRAAILPQIDGRLLGQYEKVAKARGGRALARVENRICQGCRVELPTSARSLPAVDAPGLCPHCGRMLLWPVPPAAGAR